MPSISINHNSNIEVVEEIIKIFDLVILSDTDKSFIKNHWKCIYSEKNKQNMDNIAREIKFLRKTKPFSDKQRTAWISYLIGKPLFIDFDQEHEKSIYFVSNLLKSLEKYKIQLVLVGKKVNEAEFKGWNIFGSLKDLAAANQALYNKFCHMFNISFQGRESVSIDTLKNSLPLDQLIQPSEIFYFLKDTLSIGKRINALPKFYIPRSLLRTKISLDDLRRVCEKSKAVIHCNGKSAEFMECLKKNNFDSQLLPIVTDETQIQEVHNSFCYFKLLPDNILEWMDYKFDPKMSSIFDNDKSLVVGESGIGKTTMMTCLAHNCPLNYWIVIVSLQQQSSLLKEEETTDKIIKEFLVPTKRSKLDDRVTKELLEKKQVIFFFDGLNELTTTHLNKAVTLITNIAEQGFKVWIFCTKDFQNMAQNVLGITFCYSIEPLTEEDQEQYVCRRLKDANVDDGVIDNVTTRFIESGIAKNNDIFKLPLVLYILTEIIKSCKDIGNSEELFVLDKMYTSFVEGKVQHNIKKIGCNHLDKLTVITDPFKDYYFSGYTMAALQVCFEPELFKSLNVQIDKKFFHHVKANGDYLEFIKVNEDDTITFGHYTFAEYFAALWLSENIDEIPFEVKKSILQPKYDGIRRFFDANLAEGCPLHLAIIEQDMSKVEAHLKCINDVDKGGRTPLHLAVTFGHKYPLVSPNTIEHRLYKTWGSNSNKHEEILKLLLSQVSKEMIIKPDKFLGWNLWEYADAALCLFSLEELSKKDQIQWKYLKTHYQHLKTLSYYCVTMGYKQLLKATIDHKSLSSLENEHKERPLLHLALEYNQTDIAKMLIDHGTNINQLDDMQRTPLQEAVIWGHVDLVKLLLEKGGNVNARDYLGRTALHIAAKRGYKNILQILIENEADVHSTDNEKKTPLHRAAREGKTDIVKYLVEKGACIDAPAVDVSTPLHQAAEMGHYETVKTLVECGATKEVFNRGKQTPLSYAAQEGHEDVVSYLISVQANIFAADDDGRIPREIAESRGHTNVAKMLRDAENNMDKIPDPQQNQLHAAVETGQLETLKQLINSGGKIEEINKNNETLLHIAAARNHLDIVQYLLSKQANTFAKNCDGRIPLHLACQNGHMKIVKELLTNDQMAAVDRWKLTPLHRAALKGRKKVVKVLVEAGADINCCSTDGGTPLHSAARGGHIDVLEYLISQKASVKAKNAKSKTCLHVAVQRGCTDAVEYLINQKREIVHDIDYRGRTALHFAVEKGYKNMVPILLQGGSDINKVNYYKETPLDIARKENRKEIVELLKKSGAIDD
ncbi:hypothetical protein Zmor_018410 [Zophobas morio]|uniref:NACHT domain-containing protein n=1 Tax=Zophobas morio TaxID=2755281 RepID=A0AA38MDI1_9CUCU|nr:hypothetical protein Zmor_018410 [Zophobas morio]